MRRRDIKVRLAENEEAEVVRELAGHSGFAFDAWMDWSHIKPHWLVAEYEGHLIGCLQVCHGRPVGRLEILGIPPTIEGVTRAWVTALLIRQGAAVLHEYGASALSAVIPFSMKPYKRFLKKRGAVTLESGNIVLLRIR